MPRSARPGGALIRPQRHARPQSPTHGGLGRLHRARRRSRQMGRRGRRSPTASLRRVALMSPRRRGTLAGQPPRSRLALVQPTQAGHAGPSERLQRRSARPAHAGGARWEVAYDPWAICTSSPRRRGTLAAGCRSLSLCGVIGVQDNRHLAQQGPGGEGNPLASRALPVSATPPRSATAERLPVVEAVGDATDSTPVVRSAHNVYCVLSGEDRRMRFREFCSSAAIAEPCPASAGHGRVGRHLVLVLRR